MISEDDYEKICSIIDRHIEKRWVSMSYVINHITTGGVTAIKDEIKRELVVEDDKNAKSLHHR